MKTGIFIGRFQPFHEGHRKCIERILETCDRVVILLRYGKENDQNPFSREERASQINTALLPHVMAGRAIVIPFYDPGYDLTVFIGRDVGYDLIQLDAETEAISATDIRKALYGTS